MHSSTVLSSLLFVAAVAFAAPAAPSSSSTRSSTASAKPTSAASTASAASARYTADSSITAPSYTADSSITTASYTADSSFSVASPAATGHFNGKPGSDGEAKPQQPGKPDAADVDAAAFPAVVSYNTRSGNQDFIAKLLTAPTQQERTKLLNQPGDFVFDFNDDGAPEGSESVGKGGFSVAATAKTFPALIGNGAAMTVGFLGPCGMNTAHVHPRGTELNIVVQGRLVTNFFVENGVGSMQNTLSKYQMTVFPQGAIHQEFNPDCEDAVFVAGFNSVDPGVGQIAQSFFGLRPDVVSATLGGVSTINGADLESFRDLIPANIALGVESCLKKCGIQKKAKRDISEILAN